MSAKVRAYSSYVGLALTFLLALGAVFMVSTLGGRSSANAAMQLDVPIEKRAAKLLSQIGLDPQTLSAAGASPQQTTAVVIAALAYADEHGDSIDALTLAAMTARRDVQEMERKVRSGRAQEGDVESLGSLRSASASAQSSLDAALAAALDEVTSSLGNTINGRIETLRGNVKWRVPIEYRSVVRTEGEWVTLQRVWLQSQAALRQGMEITQATADALSTCEGASEVIAAKAALQSNLELVRTAWNEALTPE